MVERGRGKKVQKLVKMLQNACPEWYGLSVTWSIDKVYLTRGAWLHTRMDVWRWEAVGTHYSEDGSSNTIVMVGSYETITDLIRHKRLVIDQNMAEVDWSDT